MAADAADVRPEVPTAAVSVAESVAWLLGWNVVIELPVESLEPVAGVKVNEAVGGAYAAAHTTGKPASFPEAGHPEPGVHVTLAVTV